MKPISSTNPRATNWWHCEQIVRVLSVGGVVACPTEAVWGLSCHPWDEAAVADLLALKQRPAHKGLIIAASTPDQVAPLLEGLSTEARALVEGHWPGPVTCLLPDPDQWLPAIVRGQHRTVAVRVTAHPVLKQLCERMGGPLVSTSCNPAGRSPARAHWQVRRYFGTALDGIMPGELGDERRPSRILNPATRRWLR
ncbi:L-threonylcarbamoyladenylate synthase [Tamilnaduibacter salinus]|uniref:Threonylcarbamoyl-AMP synthase n=1 Tax=Tamilnaduibacter salinus TaxID=1484056 RepID=A0A2U1CY78_9GAMM|nr:L-threonylcarbamoyladenylate synthase [Tamilnaduibacter salinus]PVY77448.1 L-threonylcarbamoyladenylate synthase [Tamilnaduibacter salinus]